MLGCGRHRGSPPPIYAWLRLPAQLSHIEKSLPPHSCWNLQKQSDVFISTCFLLKDLNLCLDLTFCYLLVLPYLTSSWFIHPCFFSLLKLPIFLLTSLCHFWIGSLIFYRYIFHSLIIPFSLIQFYLNLHEHWFWVGGCSLGAALVNSTGHWRNSLCCNKIETQSHRSSRWFSDGHAYPCFHKKGLLKIVMSVGFLEQLYTIFWPRNRCEWVFEIPVRAMKTRWTIFVKSHGVGITKYKLP